MANQLEEAGWVVGSRRHRGGAGDILATHPDGRRWLVECKATQGMWSCFPPADRKALTEYADHHGMTPWLAWRLPGNRIRWVSREAFPQTKG